MKPEIVWEKVPQAQSMKLPSFSGTTWRAKVPGGWLVSLQLPNGSGLTFYPDPHHAWERDPEADQGASRAKSGAGGKSRPAE